MEIPRVGGQTILVVGLARSGCAAGALLRRHGARVIGFDDAQAGALEERWTAQGLRELAGEAFDEIHTGGDWEALAGRRLDGVVLSPGVPLSHPRVVELARHTPVWGELEWAARFFPGRVIAITGTNGKTTTTELTAHLARAVGWRSEALGNVGRPFSLRADRLPEDSLAVIEVSSFQLESILTFRPQVAVVLNLEPDHLDRYADVAAYHAAKRRLVEALPPEGTFVTWTGCQEARGWASAHPTLLFGARAEGAAVCVDGGALVWRGPSGAVELAAPHAIGIKGEANLRNAAAAVAALLPFGPAPEALAAGLRSFGGLPHRQQLVARLGEVEFVDDSKGTNVAAVAAGLAGYREGVVLIAGGRGKGEDYRRLRAALGPVRAALLIGEEGPAIAAAIEDLVPVESAPNLPAAVVRAAELARPSGTVLLSPACASFDMFRDYAERGEVFAAAARRLGAQPIATPPPAGTEEGGS